MLNTLIRNKLLANDFAKTTNKLTTAKTAEDLYHPPIRSFETQEYRSDFIYRLTSLQLGDLSFMSLPDFHPGRQLQNIIISSPPKTVIIPITSFFGCQAGKSGVYPSLKTFADSLYIINENDSRHFRRRIKFQSIEDFRENIEVFERRFSDHPVSAHYFSWSNKYYLSACDCSHTIAAIYRQCIEQGRNYEISCELREWFIDREKLKAFNNEYLLLSMPPALLDRIIEVFCRQKVDYSAAAIPHTKIKTLFVSRSETGAIKTLRNFAKQNFLTQNSIINLSENLLAFSR